MVSGDTMIDMDLTGMGRVYQLIEWYICGSDRSGIFGEITEVLDLMVAW